MVRYTLKILLHLLQDSESVSDSFGELCIIGLRLKGICKEGTDVKNIVCIFFKMYH